MAPKFMEMRSFGFRENLREIRQEVNGVYSGFMRNLNEIKPIRKCAMRSSETSRIIRCNITGEPTYLSSNVVGLLESSRSDNFWFFCTPIFSVFHKV